MSNILRTSFPSKKTTCMCLRIKCTIRTTTPGVHRARTAAMCPDTVSLPWERRKYNTGSRSTECMGRFNRSHAANMVSYRYSGGLSSNGAYEMSGRIVGMQRLDSEARCVGETISSGTKTFPRNILGSTNAHVHITQTGTKKKLSRSEVVIHRNVTTITRSNSRAAHPCI
jgi:hypothetical protein